MRQVSIQHPEAHLCGLRIAHAARSNRRQLQFHLEPPPPTHGEPRAAGSYTLIVQSATWHLKHRGRCVVRHNFWPRLIDQALADCMHLSVRRARLAADDSRLWLDGAIEITFSGETGAAHGWMLTHNTTPLPCLGARG